MKHALIKAIRIAGGQTALARAIGHPVKQQHVGWWLHRSTDGVPARYCIQIEKITRGKVSRYQLRRDVFGRAPKQSEQ